MNKKEFDFILKEGEGSKQVGNLRTNKIYSEGLRLDNQQDLNTLKEVYINPKRGIK